ncbi:MAG TPA: DUF433 domain-containing protein [Thermoanaerobaculia bacterium]|nr:DUF433 domain-containing protein [Thermoanaerobaculia bacterium]
MAENLLHLPTFLQEEARELAQRQGVSLDQFIVWAVAEKVGELKQSLDDPRFPHVTYRRGSAGRPTPVVRGTGIRVQTLVISAKDWQMSTAVIAENYDLTQEQVEGALAFYEAHRGEIESSIAEEVHLEEAHG